VNNTGPSAVISPEGRILKLMDYMERGVLIYDLPVNPDTALNTLNRPERIHKSP
jgi:apolipoprotein N-acyltransferase